VFVQPSLQWKSNKYYIFWVHVCSLMYPACNAHAPYCRVVCPALKYWSTLSHKRHDFEEKKKLLNIKLCSDLLYKFCPKHYSFQEELSEIWSKMYFGLHVRYPLFLFDFNETGILDRFSKSRHISNIMKIPSVRAELFHDGRTDRQTWRS
jgi:hypothetical protein